MTAIKKSIERVDDNNLKALGIIKHVLFALMNGGDHNELDIVSSLEAVEDYLVDNNQILSNLYLNNII